MPATRSAAPPTAETHARLAGTRARLAASDAEIVRTQIELAEIPAPTGDEGERGERVRRRFEAAGLHDVRVDDAGNVLGVRRGAADLPPVVLLAHLDTVFPRETPLHVRRLGARLVGPGIGDNGRGLAVMLALADALDGERVRTRRSVLFAATTGEEGAGDLRGAKRLFADAASAAHAAIALDGAGDERVVHQALGAHRVRVTFTGPGGHSWAQYGVANPVHAAGEMAARLAALPLPLVPRASLSVTRVGGGTSVNAIPAEAWVEVDVRATHAPLLERLAREVEGAARAAAAAEDARRRTDTPPLGVHVARIGDRPCGETPPSDPIVRAAYEATRLVGRTPAATAASTDANVPIGLGIPAVAIGAGGHGGGAHTLGEWFDNTDGARGVARALTLVATAAELA